MCGWAQNILSLHHLFTYGRLCLPILHANWDAGNFSKECLIWDNHFSDLRHYCCPALSKSFYLLIVACKRATEFKYCWFLSPLLSFSLWGFISFLGQTSSTFFTKRRPYSIPFLDNSALFLLGFFVVVVLFFVEDWKITFVVLQVFFSSETTFQTNNSNFERLLRINCFLGILSFNKFSMVWR